MKETDEQLVQRMAAHDESALIAFHSRYAHLLVAFLGRMVDDPDEVMQSALDTFSYVWSHAEYFDADKLSAKAWLVTIAHRTTLNRRRDTQLDVMPLQSWDVSPRHAEPVDDAQTEEALADLTQEARDYFKLAFYRGYSQRQVAEETATSLNDVQVELHQALQRLRSKLTGGDA